MHPDEPAVPRAEGGAALPPCYRHPDRETGVACVRCGRPICPNCMVSASVGFQCPECVEGTARAARKPTTRFGGALTTDGALVTRTLIALNLLVFVFTEFVDPALKVRLGLVSLVPVPGLELGLAAGPGEWYRMVTAMFVHGGIAHIVMNMISLWVLGPPLERALGRVRFLALYLVSGLAGNALAYLVSGESLYSLGASGAIFGLLGATVVLFRQNRVPLGPVVALLVFNLVITFAVPAIDWRAHVGGLVAGVVTAAGLMYAPRAHRSIVQGLTVAGVLGVTVLVLVLQTARLSV
ncbi:rhomboid family intramembrane serine protease [Kitasatospora camelliae]|uniref:Rhomboid family intramembrane serine protease n=1 Tax=Kitasatospora camelliae TaxID=3156397 RepID=A0AAU8JXT5_9ACTN